MLFFASSFSFLVHLPRAASSFSFFLSFFLLFFSFFSFRFYYLFVFSHILSYAVVYITCIQHRHCHCHHHSHFPLVLSSSHPADVMATLGADVIIAVDVSPTSPQDYQHHRHPATTAAASTPPSLVTDVDGRPVSNNTGTSISNRTGTTAAIAAASAVVPGAITPAAPTSESPSSSAAAGKELEQHQLQNRRSGGSSCRKGSKKGRRGKSERMVPAAPPSATLGIADALTS